MSDNPKKLPAYILYTKGISLCKLCKLLRFNNNSLSYIIYNVYYVYHIHRYSMITYMRGSTYMSYLYSVELQQETQ